MTYNWNTMEEITVPTGTNGWMYSGEVIINGVKVRFPVGTPTSVPEPAAVLLKKMIELEQEEDANTAKPQNHYVGDVTIPAGKTLTLEKGAKFVDNSGPSEVVILPETEFHCGMAEAQTPITTPLSATPTAGAAAKVTYNGKEYPCTIVYTEQNGIVAYAMGNFDAIGAPYTGGNPDAPFVIALDPNGEGGVYGMVAPLDDSTTITLSIVQVGAASGGGSASAGGGVCVINMTCDANDSMNEFTNATKDKTFAEAKAVYDAGGIVHVRLEYKSGPMAGMKIEFPHANFASMGEMTAFMFDHSSTAGANYILIQSDDTFSIAKD